MNPPATTNSFDAGRLTSVDAYRGFVMLLMLGALGVFASLAQLLDPDNAVTEFLQFHSEHVAWVGASLHDMIQPAFSFLVGVALPYSIASRMARGQSMRVMLVHALWRSLALVALGVLLRNRWTFEDTLAQIGLGYPFLFLLGLRSVRVQWIALGLILAGYWLAWALYPLPPADFDYARVGVPPDWTHHAQGFAAHWNMNSNLGAAFDEWFLNLFPRSEPFTGNDGGYLTLSFIPTLGTMILGLIAGGWLREETGPSLKVRRFLIAGVAGIALGLALHGLGVCPLVKKIWTPTWTLFSGGVCFLMLALFYTVIDWKGKRGWAFPLVVVGMNSIAAYCIVGLFTKPIVKSLTSLGAFLPFGETFGPVASQATRLALAWLILFWMYRRKLFLRI